MCAFYSLMNCNVLMFGMLSKWSWQQIQEFGRRRSATVHPLSSNFERDDSSLNVERGKLNLDICSIFDFVIGSRERQTISNSWLSKKSCTRQVLHTLKAQNFLKYSKSESTSHIQIGCWSIAHVFPHMHRILFIPLALSVTFVYDLFFSARRTVGPQVVDNKKYVIILTLWSTLNNAGTKQTRLMY